MNCFTALLAVALFAVGCHADLNANAHYVEHTDPCTSQCQYYGKACPIQTFAPTEPGYDCNRGFCRLNGAGPCIQIPRNAVYAENTDACESLCKYSATGCPIRPAVPTPRGFDCVQGYCRSTKKGQCIRAMCFKR